MPKQHLDSVDCFELILHDSSIGSKIFDQLDEFKAEFEKDEGIANFAEELYERGANNTKAYVLENIDKLAKAQMVQIKSFASTLVRNGEEERIVRH